MAVLQRQACQTWSSGLRHLISPFINTIVRVVSRELGRYGGLMICMLWYVSSSYRIADDQSCVGNGNLSIA